MDIKTTAKQQIILQTQKFLAENWNRDVSIFAKQSNLFLKDTECFFEMVTFGTHVIMRLDECLYDWAKDNFENELPEGS